MSHTKILTIALLFVGAAVCSADTAGDLAKENAELRKRVEKLEKELQELKEIVMQQTRPLKPEGPLAPKYDGFESQKVAATAQKTVAERKPVWSNLDIQLYGYVKLDAAYDSSRVDTGDFARWVESESANKDDDQFNMTANQTKLGLKIAGPEDDDMKTSGRVEIDFYGGGEENKPHPMMRHAYMELNWPSSRFGILAGQTSDVISPLYPSTLNYSVAWWAGNIGYRRPQIRLTKSLGVAEDVDVKLEAALARTIGFSGDAFPDTPGDAGEDAGFPGAQARIGLTFPWLEYKPTTLGFSGHWAREELDTSASGDSKHFDSWSLNLDLDQPVNKWLAVKAELFTGEDLSAYLGGIAQGVNTSTFQEIGSRGGWVAAALGPWNKWSFNVGVSVDDVDNDDLVGIAGDRREYNRSIFGNVIYSLNNSTQIGFELSQWHTEYDGQDDGDSVRAQTSFIYRF